MFERWMVTWVPTGEPGGRKRRTKAQFFERGSMAYLCWEEAMGVQVAIYRQVKKGGNQLKARHYVWELVEYVESRR